MPDRYAGDVRGVRMSPGSIGPTGSARIPVAVIQLVHDPFISVGGLGLRRTRTASP